MLNLLLPGWFKLSLLRKWEFGGCRAVLGDERSSCLLPVCPSCPELFGSRNCLVGEHRSGLIDGQHGPQAS